MSKKVCSIHGFAHDVEVTCKYCDGLREEKFSQARKQAYDSHPTDYGDDEDEDTQPILYTYNTVTPPDGTVTRQITTAVKQTAALPADETSFADVLDDDGLAPFDANGSYDGFDDLDLGLHFDIKTVAVALNVPVWALLGQPPKAQSADMIIKVLPYNPGDYYQLHYLKPRKKTNE